MILSVHSHSPYKSAAGEIRCASNQLGTIFEFVKEHPNKRYNILFTKEQELNKLIEQIEYIKTVAKDYTIECEDVTILKKLLDLGLNAYLRFPATDWETF